MNSITFKATSKTAFDTHLKPYPASQSIPEWWREMTPYHKGTDNPEGKKLFVNDGASNVTFKKCTPMLDSLTSGYIIPLWTDVQIQKRNLGFNITWRTKQPVFEMHQPSSFYMDHPEGYHTTVMKYLNAWIPQTPKGYSCLITSPFGYRNLSFRAIPAIIDTDKSVIDVPFPVWVKDVEDGTIIEKGTPIVQIIPFKRENWESVFTYYEDEEHLKVMEKTFNSNIVNHYIRNVWSKKVYK